MRHPLSSTYAAAETRGAPLRDAASGLQCRRDHDVAKGDMTLLAALQINGAGHCLVAIEGAAGEAGDLLIVDDSGAVLHHGDFAAYECDVEGLPYIRTARQFRRRREEAIDAAGVM